MLLKPNKDETEQDFVARFMSDSGMMDEFPAKAQRSAVAYSQFEKKPVDQNQEEFSHIAHNMSMLVQKQVIGGKEFLIAPVKMMPVECVMNGILYTGESTQKAVQEWNGRAVVVYHPNEPVTANTPQFLAERQIGLLFNSRIVNGFLVADAHIDIEKAKSIPLGQKALSYIDQNKNMDVSTAMRNIGYLQNGNMFGRDYKKVSTHALPDHLALLPDQRGACSWETGVGFARNNDNGNSNPNTEKKTMERKELVALLISSGIVAANKQEEFEKLDDAAFQIALNAASADCKKTIEDGIAAKALLEEESKKAKPVAMNAEDAELLAWAKTEHKAQKDAVIGGIVANKDCGFTAEELGVKPLAELRKIEALAKRPVNYGGNGGTPKVDANADAEYLKKLNEEKI
jgi:hypothetical protein